jgi:hypothetical protein
MRYLPMILSAGILLSVGLLAGSGPAHAAMPRSRWIVPLSPTRRSKRLPTTTDTPGDIIAVTITAMAITITMATTGPTMATATAGPILVMVMVMGVAGATKTGHSRAPRPEKQTVCSSRPHGRRIGRV